VWQRRQMPPQQEKIKPTSMKEVERTNMVMIRGQGTGTASRRDPYAMEVDRGRNCYACGGFRHMARHCRNWSRERVADRRRLEYEGRNLKGNHEYENRLKEEENLESLN